VAKTTFGFNSDRIIRQYAHGLLLESPFVPSKTNCLAVWAKIRQNGRLCGRRGETGSRNMAATPKINFLTLVSYSLLQTVLLHDALQCKARSCYRLSSVRLSVTLVDHDHISWKSWKLTAQTISPISSLFVAQRSSIDFQGNIEKFWGD